MLTPKIDKTIRLLCKLQNLLPRSALITIYKTFQRPQLDYGDIICDEAYNISSHHKIYSFQYDACLAITGDIRGTSQERLYQKLGLESRHLQCWFKKCSLCKIYENNQPIFPIQFHNEILLLILENLDKVPLLA